MLTRLLLAFRVVRGLTEAPTVSREQYNDMRTFYQQQILDLRRALDQVTRALVEERSPGTYARLSPQPVRPKAAEPDEPEMEMPFA